MDQSHMHAFFFFFWSRWTRFEERTKESNRWAFLWVMELASACLDLGTSNRLWSDESFAQEHKCLVSLFPSVSPSVSIFFRTSPPSLWHAIMRNSTPSRGLDGASAALHASAVSSRASPADIVSLTKKRRSPPAVDVESFLHGRDFTLYFMELSLCTSKHASRGSRSSRSRSNQTLSHA